MKHFFTRWRLSRLHDERREVPPALRERLARDEKLARHARTLDEIDRELSDHPPVERPPAELRRRTLEAISQMPGRQATPARAPLWPLLTSLTVAATALMLFVARPWQTLPGPSAGPGAGPIAGELGGYTVRLAEDRIQRETRALVNDTRALANTFVRDALPFASGK